MKNKPRKAVYKYWRWWLILPLLLPILFCFLLLFMVYRSLIFTGDTLVFIGEKIRDIDSNKLLNRGFDNIFNWAFKD